MTAPARADSARQVAGRVYRRGAAPFGRRVLRRMLDHNLPDQLAQPLSVLLGEREPAAAGAVADAIERRRDEIAARGDVFRFTPQPTPLGTARWAEEAKPGIDESVSLRWLATNASIPRRWGVFLHLCAEATGARTVVELGACTGISGAYLAAARSVDRFVTLEGSPPLARLAASTLSVVSGHARVVEGSFESELPAALAALENGGAGVDLAYLDGHHDEAATLQYMDAFRPHLHAGSVVVLDDIRRYAGMWRAWRRLAAMGGVDAAVDAGRFGVLVVGDEGAEPRQYDLSLYTGWRRSPRALGPRPWPGT